MGQNEEDDADQSKDEQKLDTAGIEQQGVGQADEPEKDTNEGHSSTKMDGSQSLEKGSQEQKRKLKPGESDDNRTLGKFYLHYGIF